MHMRLAMHHANNNEMLLKGVPALHWRCLEQVWLTRCTYRNTFMPSSLSSLMEKFQRLPGYSPTYPCPNEWKLLLFI